MTIASAQENTAPITLDWQIQPSEIVTLPPLDLEILKKEDSLNDLDKTLPWRYGVVRPITLTPQNAGKWSPLPNGYKVWRVAITSANAKTLAVNFKNFKLSQTARLQLFNANTQDYSKVYTASQNKENTPLGSWMVLGNTLVIEYVQKENDTQAFALEIESIIHGYRLGYIDNQLEINRGLDESGDCNYDVNCNIGADFEDYKNSLKRAVALLNLGNGTLCTATLINNTLQDKTPYLLTANHCLQNSNPTLWSFRFNWLSPTPVCGEAGVSQSINNNFTVSGAQLIAQNPQTDFALVQLVNPIPGDWNVVYAGWDRTDQIPQYQVGIHHPKGDVMKICRDNDPASHDMAQGVPVWLIKGASAGNGNGWDFGTTESGSSGSALFNHKGQIIGQLYAGWAACEGENSNGEYDIYGRFAASWEMGNLPAFQLKHWLDPNQTGAVAIGSLENSLGIETVTAQGQLLVYPNPANSFITVLNTQYPNLTFAFYDISGRKIIAGNCSNTENYISLHQFTPGLYLLQLTDQDSQKSITKKIMVNR